MERRADWHQGKVLLAGGFGGACLTVVGAPFDLVKVRQQVEPVGALTLTRSIVRSEGVRGLWRGVGPPLLVSVPTFALVFWSFDLFRRAVRSSGLVRPGSIAETAAAGALVAGPTSLLYTPIDRVKCLVQLDGRRVAAGKPARYAGAFDCAAAVVRDGGVRSLYRGLRLTVARDVPAWSVYFTVYATAKEVFSRALGSHAACATLDGRAELSPLSSFLAGGLAGSATWAVAIPVDTLKTRWQTCTAHRTHAALVATTLGAGGIASLFRGFWPIVLGGIPRDAACLLGVESAQRALTRVEDGCV